MRQITDHIVNPANDRLRIEVLDAPGPGGASHRYGIARTTDDGREVSQTLEFQNGPVDADGNGVNGLTHEALIAIVVDRLRGFQTGAYACRENALALTKLEEAQMWLAARNDSPAPAPGPIAGNPPAAQPPAAQTARIRRADPAGEPVASKGEVLVEVSGYTGSGKSAVAGEIEIAMRAIGLKVEWERSSAEKHMTGADWQTALEMYAPHIRIVERNVTRPSVEQEPSNG